MRLDTSQQFRLEQQMKLSPRIIQAMEILQLPMLALLERIEAELQSNPLLEYRETNQELRHNEQAAAPDQDAQRGDTPMVVDNGGNSDDFRRLAEFEDEYGLELMRSDTPARPRNAGERDRKLDAMANAPAPEQSLNEYLLQQWSLTECDAEIRQGGRAVINAIDADGYLRTSLEDIASFSGVAQDRLRSALKLVQTLDPIGVAARDLKECLMLQLGALGQSGTDVSLEMELVGGYLRDIEANRLPYIARRTGKSVEQIKAAIRNLSKLNPRPGSAVGTPAAPAITPDVVVDLDENGELVVDMPEGNSPRLRISKAYRRMGRDRATDRQARQFIRQNMRSAQWLISAIEQRRDTLRRVAGEVFKVQKDFLLAGPEALRPLPMADVAGKVGVHVATVSRAVAGKYAQTPRGIYPLRMFFSGGTTTDDGQDVAWDAIKLKLREVVDAEDKSNPLNDDEIASKLAESGVRIARRTVAKYRDLLGIPTARKRKQY